VFYLPSAHPLIRKLETIFALTLEEKQALEHLTLRVRDVKAGETIVREGVAG
jgi:hypothetical protein